MTRKNITNMLVNLPCVVGFEEAPNKVTVQGEFFHDKN